VDIWKEIVTHRRRVAIDQGMSVLPYVPKSLSFSDICLKLYEHSVVMYGRPVEAVIIRKIKVNRFAVEICMYMSVHLPGV